METNLRNIIEIFRVCGTCFVKKIVCTETDTPHTVPMYQSHQISKFKIEWKDNRKRNRNKLDKNKDFNVEN